MFVELLEELHSKNIQITFTEGKLKYTAPEGAINEDLIKKLKAHKSKLIKYYWPVKETNFMPIVTGGDKTPFVMVHGELANYFLSESLENDRPFYGFTHIGSDGERIKHKSIYDFVNNYYINLKKVLPHGPYLLGGYSFGGLIAFEMACNLQKQNDEVPLLVLIDCVPPNLSTYNIEEEVVIQKQSIISRFKSFINKYYWKVYYVSRRNLWNLLTILPITLKPTLRKRIIVEKYNVLLRRYKPVNRFNGKILLYVAENSKSSKNNLYQTWYNYCDELEIIKLKGNHETIMKNDESTFVIQKSFREKLETIA